MNGDAGVRVTVVWEGQQYYFVRMDGNRPEVVPAERIRGSLLVSREFAFDLCRKLRAGGWDSHIVTPDGVLLYEDALDRTSDDGKQHTAEDRVPHHVGNVLIVPGNPR